MSNILITGATGYIGNKLALFYVRKGEKVRLLVRDPGKLNIELKNNCQVVLGDVCRPATLESAVRGTDAVIHAAGRLGHWGASFKQLADVNVQGTLNIAEAAFKAGVRRFIHLSAGGVTGPVGLDPADETFPPAPVTAYERTKWQGEFSVLDYARKNGMNLLVIRPTFTYGPGDPHKLSLFKAVRRGSFVFLGDGMSNVHPVYIDDLIQGIDLGMKSDLVHHSLIIGGPEAVTKQELIGQIASSLEVPKPFIRIPVFAARILAAAFELSAMILRFTPPLTHSRVLAFSRNWGYSIAKARTELGYKPRFDLVKGIDRTVAWYKENEWL